MIQELQEVIDKAIATKGEAMQVYVDDCIDAFNATFDFDDAYVGTFRTKADFIAVTPDWQEPDKYHFIVKNGLLYVFRQYWD